MSLNEFAYWINDWPLSVAIREGDWSFPLIESTHVLAITIVVGSIGLVDLRLIGIIARQTSIKRYCREILPITWIAFTVAVASGLLLFISRAPAYIINSNFQIKMILLVVAGANMLIFHKLTWKGVDRWDVEVLPSVAARLAGVFSLLLWLGIIFFGRWIGFTLSHD